MSEDVREVYLVGYMVTEDEGSWPEIVTPERLAEAVTAATNRYGAWTGSTREKRMERAIKAALAVLAGREP